MFELKNLKWIGYQMDFNWSLRNKYGTTDLKRKHATFFIQHQHRLLLLLLLIMSLAAH